MDGSKIYKVAFLLNGINIVFEENVNESGVVVWENPMVIGLVQNGSQIILNPVCTFGSNQYIEPVEKVALIAIYDLDSKLNKSYEEIIQKLSAKRSGIEIVPAGTVPGNKNKIKRSKMVKSMNRELNLRGND